MYTDSIEQLRGHRWRTAGQDAGRDRAGGIHHAKQWWLDHVRQIPELTVGKTEVTGSAIAVRLRDRLPNTLQVRCSTSAGGILASRIR
jgi:hypothetical protein